MVKVALHYINSYSSKVHIVFMDTRSVFTERG